MIQPVRLNCLHVFEKGALLNKIICNHLKICPSCKAKISQMLPDTKLTEKIKTLVGPLVYQVVLHEVNKKFYSTLSEKQFKEVHKQFAQLKKDMTTIRASLEREQITIHSKSTTSYSYLLIALGSLALAYIGTFASNLINRDMGLYQHQN